MLTKKISFSAILIALAFLILLLGNVAETVTFSVAAIASLCVIMALSELGYKYAIMVYAATSIIAFLLLPVKDPLLYFAGFFGYYPIVKKLVERINSKIVYVLKGAIFSCAYSIVAIIGIKVLIPEADVIKYVLIGFPILLIVFYVFDHALSKLIKYYENSLRKRIGIDKLLK